MAVHKPHRFKCKPRAQNAEENDDGEGKMSVLLEIYTDRSSCGFCKALLTLSIRYQNQVDLKNKTEGTYTYTNDRLL